MYKENQDLNIAIVDEPLGLFPKEVAIKPFLKWAGGKTQLLGELHKYIPNNFNKYIEPFIGGGAMFFSLNPNESIISDSNEELIITYRQVKEAVDSVIGHLEMFEHDEEFYYSIRSLNPTDLEYSYRAARLIYLNKTCFNGLYRVNKKGQFNVPYGKGNGSFLNKDVLRNASEFLQDTKIINGDYLAVLNEFAAEGDFIFLDPPYYPVGKYSDFKRYTKEFFYHEDQVKLKKEVDRLVNIGCKVVLTNSDHEVILDLYSDYKIDVIETRRMISSNSKTRTGKDIIVVGGYV
ncbi:DNA adenine methylase [Sunxiuqinia dokdonensis]|uniref:Site-specific DNA-methyltransferase (adenine-specific) n=1 Tax=Sunxiuqinia dokdonensis TaxID=1409788 RepID=A0A0L8V3K9_9BACT|nr:Dam family site-specific DNA-(adenine-N6)-methyltransferase [Sunxiuqinia dokdonensis]KOH42792.1 site-spific DNA-methyltransferase (adenine-spific) [Sunxiuqinia dokdonensis]